MAKTKNISQQELYDQVSNQSTTEQLDLKEFIENILKTKQESAKKELELINGKKD